MKNGEPQFAGLRVLYLEDEILIALDVTSALKDAGFSTVKTVHRLKDAWEAIEAEAYDVALLDINVDRRQTSFELGDHLKKNDTIVVFASGNGTDCERLREQGFQFIDKPFSHKALTETIAEAL